MKFIDYLKLAIGLIFVSFPIIVGVLIFKFMIEGSETLDSPDEEFMELFYYTFIPYEKSTNNLIFVGLCGFSGAYLLASVKNYINFMEIKEVLPSKEPETTSTPPKRDAMEQLCKKLGIPYSKNQRQEGTASVRFMNKPKDKETE